MQTLHPTADINRDFADKLVSEYMTKSSNNVELMPLYGTNAVYFTSRQNKNNSM